MDKRKHIEFPPLSATPLCGPVQREGGTGASDGRRFSAEKGLRALQRGRGGRKRMRADADGRAVGGRGRPVGKDAAVARGTVAACRPRRPLRSFVAPFRSYRRTHVQTHRNASCSHVEREDQTVTAAADGETGASCESQTEREGEGASRRARLRAG